MKKLMALAIGGLFLAACQSATVIDWVDFIQFEGKHYVAADSAVISDKREIGRKVGEVEFKVADNIHNSNYRVKNGDAAFWEKGTELFHVNGRPDFLAVADNYEVNGYRLYMAEEAEEEFPHHFKDLDLEQVETIEIYTGEQEPEFLNRIHEDGDLEEFKALLTQDDVPPASIKNTSQQDPDIYQMILYTAAPFAHSFYLYNENGQWLWYPWDEQLLSKEVENFIKP